MLIHFYGQDEKKLLSQNFQKFQKITRDFKRFFFEISKGFERILFQK